MYLSLAILTKINLKTELSLWFIPLCLLIGFVYSFLLYSKKTSWSKQINYVLAGARFLVASILAFFLLGPLLNQIDFIEEAPIIVLNIDDSSSISEQDSVLLKQHVDQIANTLQGSGIDVRTKGLNDYINSDEIIFSSGNTNLSKSLKAIGQDFEQQNIIGAILLSDGIHNYGASPQFLNLPYQVYAVGLGDTIPARDLSIKALRHNKVIYQGKQFPIHVDVFNNGFVGKQIKVDLLIANSVLQSKTFAPKGDQQINSLTFILDADAIGIRSYELRITPVDGEATTSNNNSRAFIEIIDSQQKILIAAQSPHPDIKALRSVIEAKEGTEVSVWIDGASEDFPEGPFDLVIYHQLPGFNDLPQEIDHWIDDANSFFITGTEDLNNINQRNPVLTYNSFGQTDQVGGQLNQRFDLFDVSSESLDRLLNYPPLTVPYGTFEMKELSQVMLYQKVGNAQTNRPLIGIWNDEERKSAVLSGAGIWKWRLQELALYGDALLFEEVFGKLIQYLTTTDNKSNFIVAPSSDSFRDSDLIEFNTEVYNELYEQVYDYNIALKLSNEQGEIVEYNYVNSPSNNFHINNLRAGVYQFEASVTVNNKQEISRGSFAVEQLALEDIDLTANHQLLRNIANNSGGRFYKSNEIDALISTIIAQNPRPTTRSSEELNPLINNPVWLLLLIGLLSFEWFMRKYHGTY